MAYADKSLTECQIHGQFTPITEDYKDSRKG